MASAPEFENATETIVVDDELSTSDYESELAASSTQSLSSSIREQVFKNGRKYHRKSTDEGKYYMPTDETELDRLDMTHALCLSALQGELYTAPLKNIKKGVHRALDVGTGTGIWALDFGDIHPETQVLGVDLAPIQPSYTYPNVTFEMDDLEKDWTFRHKFDFIHARTIASGIKDWQKLTKQMFEFCNPGGYVELCEHSLNAWFCDDGSGGEDSALKLYMKEFTAGLRKIGVGAVDFDGNDYKRLLEEAGFVDVTITVSVLPAGHWAKDKRLKHLGRVLREIMRTGFDAYGLAMMTGVLGIPLEEAKTLCDGAVNVLMESKEHWYSNLWHIVGRKPE